MLVKFLFYCRSLREIKMVTEFKIKQRFEIEQCPKKFVGADLPEKEKDKKCYCDGKYNYPHCTVKFAFFGTLIALNGWLEERVEDDVMIGKNSCPEYMEYGVEFERKNEYFSITNGGQLDGFKPKNNKSPCLFLEINSNSKKLLDLFETVFEKVPKGESAIKSFLVDEMNAPNNIKSLVIRKASKKQVAENRKNIQIK
jgi:hypothetical protein